MADVKKLPYLLRMNITCMGAPLLIEGDVAGVPWEYRGRHGRWGITVGDDMIVGAGKGDPSIPLAMALIVDALWAHFMLPELDAREEAQHVGW